MPSGQQQQKGREKALELAVNQIEKQFGKGSIMKLGEGAHPVAVKVIPTGALTLDYALGIGGLPCGRVTEIFGPEMSGKTTIALHVVAEAQKRGGIAMFIDAEHALPVDFARRIGVDLDNLYISQPDTAEQALEIAETMVRSNAVDVVVIDSVAALVPRAEIEGDVGDMPVGLQARLMSQALRRLTGAISKSETCVIFINQLREKIGVLFGNPETTPGGRALKFYATIRIDVRRTGAIKEGDRVIGSRTRAKVVKNKLAAPFRTAEFDLLFDEGISREGALLDLALQQKVIERSGTWYSYSGENIGQGRENTRVFLKQHPDIAERIRQETLEKLGLPSAAPSG